jgi:hypothetical protein
MAGAESDEEIDETVEAVVATKSMPAEDMIQALLFNLYINSFHVTGITTFVSWFLHKHNGIAYGDFYDQFYNYMQQDPWFANEIAEAKSYYETWVRDGKIGHPNIGETIEISGLNLHYRIAINIYHKNLREHVLSKLRNFVDENYTVETNMLDQLFKLQDLYFIDYNKISNYPQAANFDYDFINYLISDSELNTSATYKFEYRGNPQDDLEFFCELIYYARRGQWTKARIYTVGQETVSIDE